VEYRFEDSKTLEGLMKKILFFGSKLQGIGEGETMRKAKIQCAKNAIFHLE
jgi:hypothetical protein